MPIWVDEDLNILDQWPPVMAKTPDAKAMPEEAPKPQTPVIRPVMTWPDEIVAPITDPDPLALCYPETLRLLIAASNMDRTAGGSGWIQAKFMGADFDDRKRARLQRLLLEGLAETRRSEALSPRRLWRPTEAGRQALRRVTQVRQPRPYTIAIVRRKVQPIGQSYTQTEYYGRLSFEGAAVDQTQRNAREETALIAVKKLRGKYEAYLEAHQRRYEFDKEQIEQERKEARLERTARRNALYAAAPDLWHMVRRLADTSTDLEAVTAARLLLSSHGQAVQEAAGETQSDAAAAQDGSEPSQV